jgi:hypothetical protein
MKETKKEVSRKIASAGMDIAAKRLRGYSLDVKVMAGITKKLADFDGTDHDDLPQLCINRKLLPNGILFAVQMARTLSEVLIPARLAQSVTGVPAAS